VADPVENVPDPVNTWYLYPPEVEILPPEGATGAAVLVVLVVVLVLLVLVVVLVLLVLVVVVVVVTQAPVIQE
jgi:heme/copper-type cytochrome/quinol oxidase subunit 2